MSRSKPKDIECQFDEKDFSGAWKQLKAGDITTILGTHKRKDGSTFPVETRFGLIDHNNQSFILSIARDISSR